MKKKNKHVVENYYKATSDYLKRISFAAFQKAATVWRAQSKISNEMFFIWIKHRRVCNRMLWENDNHVKTKIVLYREKVSNPWHGLQTGSCTSWLFPSLHSFDLIQASKETSLLALHFFPCFAGGVFFVGDFSPFRAEFFHMKRVKNRLL